MEFNKNWYFSELEIKKSKFIAYAFYINSEKDINKILNILKNEFKKAKHICYAYDFFQNNQRYVKYFDNQEPKGCAGLPILNVIKNNKIENVAIFVIRFFGGIKLGSGLLLRSYSKVANFTKNQINKI